LSRGKNCGENMVGGRLGQVAVFPSKDATPTPTLPPQRGREKDRAVMPNIPGTPHQGNEIKAGRSCAAKGVPQRSLGTSHLYLPSTQNHENPCRVRPTHHFGAYGGPVNYEKPVGRVSLRLANPHRLESLCYRLRILSKRGDAGCVSRAIFSKGEPSPRLQINAN